MRLARVLGIVGMFLIWMGSITLLFVAYQLWGTGLAEARAQDALEEEFQARIADLEVVTSTTSSSANTSSTSTTTTTTTTTTPPPPPVSGEAIAHMVIPAIGVDKIVVEGVSRGDLQKGPGHYPGTPLPGQPGNAAIAGHRTTYGAPFNRIDELQPGDEILISTVQGVFTYEVSAQDIVSPSDVAVVSDKGDDRLTLTSCHPKYSARQRIVVTAMLVNEPAPPPPTTVAPPAEVVLPGEEVGSGPVEAELETLDGEHAGPIAPAVRTGLLALAVWIGFFVLSRRWRRYPAYLLGAPVFAAALWVWFGAVAETLPSNF